MKLYTIDELACLIRGIHYIDRICKTETFFLTDPLDDQLWEKHHFNFGNPYPYLCVNIGSGVSILAVDRANSFKRVGGTRYVPMYMFSCLYF